MSKTTRIVLTLVAIVIYALTILFFVISFYYGIFFVQTFQENVNKELVSNKFWWSFFVFLGATGVLVLSLFLYRPIMRWFVVASLVVPPVLLIVTLLSIGNIFHSEVDLRKMSSEKLFAYNQAVFPILNSIIDIIPVIQETSCKKEALSTSYAKCVMPVLYSTSRDPFTSDQLNMIEKELQKLDQVKRQYPIEPWNFASERGNKNIRVNIESVASSTRQKCDDPRGGMETKNNYSCWVYPTQTVCELVPIQYYVGFTEACP